MLVSAEGRVEHQKQNQTATFQWPVGFVFGVQLDYSCRKKSVPSNGRNRVKVNSTRVIRFFLPIEWSLVSIMRFFKSRKGQFMWLSNNLELSSFSLQDITFFLTYFHNYVNWGRVQNSCGNTCSDSFIKSPPNFFHITQLTNFQLYLVLIFFKR